MRYLPLILVLLIWSIALDTQAQPGPGRLSSPFPVEGARFGTTITLIGREGRIAVGAPFGTLGAPAPSDPGRVYIYPPAQVTFI